MPQDKRLASLRGWVIGGLGASAVVHISQLAIYGTSVSVIIVGLFGVAYALIAWAHIRRNPLVPMFSTVLPVIGATLGIIRFALLSPNAGSVIDVLLDVLLIIPVSVMLWRSHAYRGSKSQPVRTIPGR